MYIMNAILFQLMFKEDENNYLIVTNSYDISYHYRERVQNLFHHIHKIELISGDHEAVNHVCVKRH